MIPRSARRAWLSPWLSFCAAVLAMMCFSPCLFAAASQRPLPTIRDGVTVTGPGAFTYEGTLHIDGKVILRNLDLDLRGPIVLAAGARLELDRVHLRISDPPLAPNGTSGLRCMGPASISVHNSSMSPVKSAHPMWRIEGQLDVDGFVTKNSEFHLKHTTAELNRFKIFELEASEASKVTAHDLDLFFLSTHTGEKEDLAFNNIPVNKAFSRELRLGSGTIADVKDTRVQIFLVYVHGQSKVQLADMGRVQLAMFPACSGSMHLPSGLLGTEGKAAVFPDPRSSDCAFQFSLRNVRVDSWDVYASGQSDLKFSSSVIDELVASSHARIEVSKSSLYADWLALADDARLTVSDSTVGSLRLAASRPDLATSQVRLGGRSQAVFQRVRFDCGIYANDHAEATLIAPLALPSDQQEVGSGRITRK